ncbi:uncharacterized protein UV8b_05121 [Ustilaginoidea virens]|uniref:Lipoprotein n=1 Tax=Ustilaginoidea virens TaxID=1159556 RepID=A0A8E5HT41_USTVR|nr:uncharacterized protein UV8b_05121 [Ustilaginoidea virens]QUC20880.1 hypothetical protein UV8b_05121 [Ustilaginoidea virens]
MRSGGCSLAGCSLAGCSLAGSKPGPARPRVHDSTTPRLHPFQEIVVSMSASCAPGHIMPPEGFGNAANDSVVRSAGISPEGAAYHGISGCCGSVGGHSSSAVGRL